MDEICGLKSHLLYVDTIQIFIEIHPCTITVIFITEFSILWKNPPFKNIFQKGFQLEGISKKK